MIPVRLPHPVINGDSSGVTGTPHAKKTSFWANPYFFYDQRPANMCRLQRDRGLEPLSLCAWRFVLPARTQPPLVDSGKHAAAAAGTFF
jgi:hypothetical protein